MNITRYNAMREELQDIWQRLKYKLYYLYFPLSAKMELEQISQIEYRFFTDAVDNSHVHRPSLQKATVEELMFIVPNLSGHKDLAYRKTKDAVMIYEDIQRYITLWLDVITELPEFAHPPISQLYQLEEVAKWAFTQYKVERYYMSERAGKLQTVNEQYPLLQFLATTGVSFGQDPNDISFESHLDDRLPRNLRVNPEQDIDKILGWADPSLSN